jgi:uncharacterized protein (DUF2164 family)
VKHVDKVNLDRDDREIVLARLREHLRDERGEDVGDLAAVLLYDFIAADVAPFFYNEGIAAAQEVLRRAGDAVESELDSARLLPRITDRERRTRP